MNPFTTHGVFSWVELMTADLAAAKKFYGEVFGWRFSASHEAAGFESAEIGVGRETIGSMAAGPPGCPVPPGWNTYVTVTDIAKTLEHIVGLGGRVVFGPQDIPGVGRCAVVRDPWGAVLLTVQHAISSLPPGVVPEFRPARMTPVGAFSWWGLLTPDAAAAKAFYGGVFGWTFENVPDYAYEYDVIAQDGQMIGGLMQGPAGTGPCWSVYVRVADTDAICDNARRNGGTILHGPEDLPAVGRLAVLQDPTGGVLCAMQWSMCNL
ncbi:MAG: VOC family protein [Phycisphaerae bacterium]|nr:VOC family protein [Phycisphaerae bacterium]